MISVEKLATFEKPHEREAWIEDQVERRCPIEEHWAVHDMYWSFYDETFAKSWDPPRLIAWRLTEEMAMDQSELKFETPRCPHGLN